MLWTGRAPGETRWTSNRGAPPATMWTALSSWAVLPPGRVTRTEYVPAGTAWAWNRTVSRSGAKFSTVPGKAVPTALRSSTAVLVVKPSPDTVNTVSTPSPDWSGVTPVTSNVPAVAVNWYCAGTVPGSP